KSPTGRPDHTSPGDVILETAPLRNATGARIGTFYAELRFMATAVNFNNVVLERSVFLLGDGKIVEESVNGPHTGESGAIVGGTGARAGARAPVVELETQ